MYWNARICRAISNASRADLLFFISFILQPPSDPLLVAIFASSLSVLELVPRHECCKRWRGQGTGLRGWVVDPWGNQRSCSCPPSARILPLALSSTNERVAPERSQPVQVSTLSRQASIFFALSRTRHRRWLDIACWTLPRTLCHIRDSNNVGHSICWELRFVFRGSGYLTVHSACVFVESFRGYSGGTRFSWASRRILLWIDDGDCLLK